MILKTLTLKKKAKDNLKLINEVASADIIEIDDFPIALSEIKTDVGHDIVKRTYDIIKESYDERIEKRKELESVTVSLKDNSIFAYVLRKFVWTERLQIREIIDLLKHDIIKESCSPYCSRIVPVRKRNGNLRLCVDLRLLNDRIVKQKYPFPVIEDCLS